MRARRLAYLLIPLALVVTGCRLNVSVTGSGTVVSDPVGIECTESGGSCTYLNPDGQNVAGSLTADPDDGWRFVEWTGECASFANNPVCSGVWSYSAPFGAPAVEAVGAVFERIPSHTLGVTVDGEGTGTVTSLDGISCPDDCTEDLLEATEVTLTATPDDDSEFAGWTDCPAAVDNVCTLTLAAAAAVTATFDLLPTFGLSVTLDGSGDGTVSSDAAGISCPEDCAHDFVEDTEVVLTATADDGSTFEGWTGCPSVDGDTCTVTVTAIAGVTATFDAIPTYPLTINLGGHGSGSVVSEALDLECEDDQCVISVLDGTEVSLEAVAAEGSVFEGWSGACEGTEACDLTMTVANEVTAVFELADDEEPEGPNDGSGPDREEPDGCDLDSNQATCPVDGGEQRIDADDTDIDGLTIEFEGVDGEGSVEVRRLEVTTEEAVLGEILELTASGVTFRRATVCLPAPQEQQLRSLGLRLSDLLVAHDHEDDQTHLEPTRSADGTQLCVRVGEFSKFWVTYPPRTDRSTDGGPAATAASWAVQAYESGVDTVFLGSTAQSVDSLVAAAGMRGADIALLLSDVDALPAATQRALTRLSPQRVVVLGGPGVISDSVLAQVAALTGATVSRASGGDRYATAAEISRLSRWEAVAHVYVVNGETAADLPVVAAAAAHDGSAVVLTAARALPASSAARLAELSPTRVTIVGGRAAISESVLAEVRTLTGAKVGRVAGSNRYATATAVMRGAYAVEQPVAYEADLANSASTVTATAAAAAEGALLLLTPPEGAAEAPERLGTKHVNRFGPGPR